MNNKKTIYAWALRFIAGFSGYEGVKWFDALIRFRRILHLKNPKSLADKICWLGIHAPWDVLAKYSDKWEVRQYIREKGLEHILIPVYGEAKEDAASLDLEQLPDSFIIKATHGCKMNYICKDKSDLDITHCRSTIQQWLNTIYGTYSGEFHYSLIKPRYYIEAYMDNGMPLMDYKFFCYNGKPQWILVCRDRSLGKKGDSKVFMYQYDLAWNPINKISGWKNHIAGFGSIKKPVHLDEMIRIASILSEDFNFVRVDLYEYDHGVRFGELTFTPSTGVMPAYDKTFLLAEGKKLVLSKPYAR